ncbi:hypothetical protein [Derxia gummosa]|uniref:Uncharacterized protein n=1 Tax=Derxia gummosa DSM 723 TaxID=1121388 RepID=A0A8B6X2H2_9BURK|nr:hypothetical protein [Derxia gummosa]
MPIPLFPCLSPDFLRRALSAVWLAALAPACTAAGLDAGVTLGHLRLAGCAASVPAGTAQAQVPGLRPVSTRMLAATPARSLPPLTVHGSTAARVVTPDGSMVTRDGEGSDDGVPLAGTRHRSQAVLPGVSASAEAGSGAGAGDVAGMVGSALTRGGAARAGSEFAAEASETADYALPPRGCLVARIDYRLDFLAAADLRGGRIELLVGLDGGRNWTERAVVRELTGADGESHGGTLELELRNPGSEPLSGRLAAQARALGKVTAVAASAGEAGGR